LKFNEIATTKNGTMAKNSVGSNSIRNQNKNMLQIIFTLIETIIW